MGNECPRNFTCYGQPMKICFLTSMFLGASFGGVENHILHLSRELATLGNEVVIFVVGDRDLEMSPEGKSSSGVNVKYFRIPCINSLKHLKPFEGRKFFGVFLGFLRKFRFFPFRRRISNIILKGGFEIVHQHDFVSNVFSTKLISEKIPCFLTNHTGEFLLLNRMLGGRALLQHLLSHYLGVIGPSRELVPCSHAKNTVYIPNGVDLGFFSQAHDREALRKELSIPLESFVVFCPRRWSPTKGIIFLAQALAEGSYPETSLTLFAGNGGDEYLSYQSDVQAQLKNAKRRYKLLGTLNQESILKYYQASDVVIIPSIMEATSLAALEGMACGACVVSSAVGGMPEIISNGQNGMLIPPGDPKAIVKALRFLASSPRELTSMKSNGILHAKDFSWRNVAIETLLFYNRSLRHA